MSGIRGCGKKVLRQAMKNKIKAFAKQLGLEQIGVCPHPEEEGCCIVCLFPYFAGIEPGNLSIYARGMDYHLVCRSYLMQICDYIRELGLGDFSKCISCDTGPYHERELARQAGLGFIGKNGCLIHKRYGSYCFIGVIACQGLDLEPDAPEEDHCMECGNCIKACPGKALGEESFRLERCLSHISQKRGELSKEEQALLERSPLVWGCDQCQSVCPHNQGVPLTPLAQFRENLIDSIEEEEIKSLSNREFLKKYKGRSFTWRGKGVLMRNLELKRKNI